MKKVIEDAIHTFQSFISSKDRMLRSIYASTSCVVASNMALEVQMITADVSEIENEV